ncbi:hypothetical protein ZWY2020_035609 [Hordeum vulgare]|nr:hypothetical protein ZWY2020_035609 [Hordeum vulgare]
MAARVGDAVALRRALDKAALVVAAGEVGVGLEAVRCAVAAEANKAGETPLLASLEKGRLEVVVELLRHLDAHGIAAEANEAGKTQLLAAAEKGHLEVVVELLRYLDAQSIAAEANKAGETLLLVAVEKGHLEVVVELLRHLDAYGGRCREEQVGYDALHIAAREGHHGETSMFTTLLPPHSCLGFVPSLAAHGESSHPET